MDRAPGRWPLLDMATRRPKPKNARFWSKNAAEVRAMSGDTAKVRTMSGDTAEVRTMPNNTAEVHNQVKMSVFAIKTPSRPDKQVDEKKTSRDGGGSDLGELYQAGPGTPGCKGTPEPKPKCA